MPMYLKLETKKIGRIEEEGVTNNSTSPKKIIKH